ncbi:MAG: metallophosphoesterase [Clostridia bacterium]|nr:metallophosphoesterase [Clostridia bacterium]MBP3359598.1 metallophosphoesterase [Clostridia bacterium]
MDKQHFIDAGYVDFGYISPELTSNSEYPEYIVENVTESVRKIQQHQTRSSFSFGFMADIHYSTTYNHDIRTKRLFNAYKEIAKRAHIDMLVLGGDYVNDGVKENYKVRNYRELRAHLDGIKYLPVNGNHDDNWIWDNCIEAELAEHQLTADEIYNLFYNHLVSLGAEFDAGSEGLYYFYNDVYKKVRYIFIDTNDVPMTFNEKGEAVHTEKHIFALSQRQTDWLINKALCFDEEGWSVVFIAHTAFLTSMKAEHADEYAQLKVINEIADSYKLGRDLDAEFGSGDYKIKAKAAFSEYKRAEVVGVFGGHWHKDIIEITEAGVPHIYANCVMMYLPYRKDGEKSEILFDIVTVDRESRTIHITRTGYGEDRTVNY